MADERPFGAYPESSCLRCKFFWEDLKTCSIVIKLHPERCEKFELKEVDFDKEDSIN